MSAHESMEQAEQAKEASSENRKIALLIAVIALFLALSETLGKGAQTESIAKNVEASNLWAFFQAKSIRHTVVQTAAEQGKLGVGTASGDAAKAAAEKQIDGSVSPIRALRCFLVTAMAHRIELPACITGRCDFLSFGALYASKFSG